jgi:hypothetical protein
MKSHAHAAIAASLLALGLAGGYGLAEWRLRAEIPPKAIPGVLLPEGVASELRQILLIPDDFERTARVSAFLEPLGPEALPAVRAAYDSVVLNLGDVEIVQLVQWWGRFDPEAAFDWARASKIGWHPGAVSAAAKAWARLDPETASWELVRRVQDPRLGGAALVGIVSGWEQSGHAGLEEFLISAPPGADEYFALGFDAYVRGHVLREGPQATIAWVEGLPDLENGQPTPFKQRAFQQVATLVVDYDPQIAGDFAARHRGPTWGIGLLLRVGMAWAEKDGAAALHWLSTLPPGHEVPTVVQETYRKWFTADLPAASKWIAEQKPEPWIDPAYSTFALWRTRESFPEALEWAARVQDPHRRDLAYVKVALAWLRKSPEEAQAWLDHAELSDFARERIEKLRKLRLHPPVKPKLPELDPFKNPSFQPEDEATAAPGA